MRSRFGELCLLMILAVLRADSAGIPPTLSLENKAVRLSVNNTDDGRGRFAVDVIGGDPARAADDGQPLIYGRPIPWTSYTTVRVDGRDFVFGGPTSRRSGKGLSAGDEITPPFVGQGAIATTWRFGDVEVTQRLSIAEGPTTGAPDSVRIAYTLVNRGSAPRRVGLRICLDTMLGANDGAPFRLGAKGIQSDACLRGSEVEPYWQAFDSLDDPRVIAQGSLAGGELTPPDLVYFTNWGTLADTPWEPALVDGRDFTRLGEFEPDSAVAMLWDEVTLAPGGAVTRITYYGLGGVTIARGQLSLGLTAPASVSWGRGRVFTILAYLENNGAGVAQETAIKLELPDSLRPLSPLRVELGRVKPGESRQVAWMVEAAAGGTAKVRATAEAFGLAPVTVERSIRLVAPALIGIAIPPPPAIRVVKDRYQPYPAVVTAVVANTGGEAASGAWAEIAPGLGLRLAPGEGEYRWLGPLGPGEQMRVSWAVVCAGPAGSAGYSVLAGAGGSPAVSAGGAVHWPDLPGRIRVLTTADGAKPEWYRVEISLINLPEAARLTLRLGLPEGFRLAAVQRGGFMATADGVLSWLRPPVLSGGGLILEATRPTAIKRREENLATVWLVGTKGAAPALTVEVIRLLDEAGLPLPANVVQNLKQ